jgi:hypothetical protein
MRNGNDGQCPPKQRFQARAKDESKSYELFHQACDNGFDLLHLSLP